MAQQFYFENSMQTTVNFSTVEAGELFLYNDDLCLRIERSNPNYVLIQTGGDGTLAAGAQVLLPSKVTIKLE